MQSFQRRLNVDCFNISPDLNFILLYECEPHSSNGTKYSVYEIYSSSTYSLSVNESANDEVELQKVLWSPESSSAPSLTFPSSASFTANNNNKALPSSRPRATEKSKISQAIAFVNDYDIYYKPKVHTDLVLRITNNGEFEFKLNFMVVPPRLKSSQFWFLWCRTINWHWKLDNINSFHFQFETTTYLDPL